MTTPTTSMHFADAIASTKAISYVPSTAPASPAPTDTDTSEYGVDDTIDSDVDNDNDSDVQHGADDSQHPVESRARCSIEPRLCLCEVQQHISEQSCWLVVSQRVYDVTAMLATHPGGTCSILRKAGGAVDCAADMAFHSRSARKTLDKYFVGKLLPCSNSSDSNDNGVVQTNETQSCCIM